MENEAASVEVLENVSAHFQRKSVIHSYRAAKYVLGLAIGGAASILFKDYYADSPEQTYAVIAANGLVAAGFAKNAAQAVFAGHRHEIARAAISELRSPEQ